MLLQHCWLSPLLHHQCRYICLQSTTFKAYNYNVTEGTCTRFASLCPQAYSDSTMECVVFRKTPINQCYEWVPYNPGDPLDERMIATDSPSYIVARLHVSGNNVVYFSTITDACWGKLEGTQYSTQQGYLCERLRVVEDCTIFWVPYTAGASLPSPAVIGGVMANGDVANVVKFDCIYRGTVKSLFGYYTEGATHAISSYGGTTRLSATMMMMIVL